MTTRTPEQLALHFWSSFGPLLFGADRAPQTEAEWIAAGKQLRGLVQLDQLATRLEQAAAQPQRPAGRAAQRHPETGSVYYNDAGDACCPQHERPLKEGRYGLYCSAKDPNGKNGYCNFRMKEA